MIARVSTVAGRSKQPILNGTFAVPRSRPPSVKGQGPTEVHDRNYFMSLYVRHRGFASSGSNIEIPLSAAVAATSL